MINKAVWCYAEDKSGNWEAICLDFDLSVQGSSFAEVYRDMNESISMYLEYIEGLPREERARFLNRKAPANLRLKCILMLLFSTLFESRKNGKNCAGFLVYCQV